MLAGGGWGWGSGAWLTMLKEKEILGLKFLKKLACLLWETCFISFEFVRESDSLSMYI